MSLSTVMNDLTLVSDAAYLDCSKALVESVNNRPDEAAADGTIDVVMAGFSSILSKGYPLPGTVLTDVTNAITSLALARQQLMAVDEVATEVTTQHIRLSTFRTAGPAFNSINLVAPQSSLESLYNIVIS